MKILDFLTGGLSTAVENIATEWIDTDKEKAEAQSLFIKTLDPNGLMRRQISITVSLLYSLYILVTLFLIIIQAFNPSENISLAMDNIVTLFIPITSLFGIIVGASFGVNYQNIKQGK